MEAKCLSKAKGVSLDIITTLPQTIIETILCLLPIQEAATTSILSREWRYKWTKIPKLVFCWSTTVPRRTNDIEWEKGRHKFFCAIHQVLLLRQGPILEFTLSCTLNRQCYQLNQIILHLSMNHPVKKLSLYFDDSCYYNLPSCFFSLHQLTDLDLNYVNVDHQPTFSGFGSLRSLCLYDVLISTEDLLHLLSNCPSLTSFTLLTDLTHPRLENCTIIQLFECLPMIEDLTVYMDSVRPLVRDLVPKELPTSLINLKCFRFKEMSFVNDVLLFLAVLIKCSPNLERLTLEIPDSPYEDETYSGILEEYSDVWLEHLIVLEIDCFSNLKHDMEFVKFILARSPKLKKVSLISVVEKDEQVEMLKVLLRAPRASPVEIFVE